MLDLGSFFTVNCYLVSLEAKTMSRGIAQLAERRSPKPKVVGSIPTAPAK